MIQTLDMNSMGLAPLDEIEMQEIDGGGFLGALIGAVVGAVVGATLEIIDGGDIGLGILSGALIGGAAGAALPI